MSRTDTTARLLLTRTPVTAPTAPRLVPVHKVRSGTGRATIVVGGGDLAVRVATALRQDRSCGLTPVGFVGPRTLAQRDMPVLAGVQDLEQAVIRYRPLHLIVAYPAVPDGELVARLHRCRQTEPWTLKYPSVPIRRAVLHGSVPDALIRAGGGARLLVVGDKRRGVIGRARTGDVPLTVAAEAPCPVAVVPLDQHEREPL